MNMVQLGSTVLIQSCDCFIILRYETYCSDYLPPCGRVLLQKLVIGQVLKKLPVFYGTKSFIMNLQDPGKGSYPEPGKSNPHAPTRTVLHVICFNISLSYMPFKFFIPLMSVTCPAQLVLLDLIFLLMFDVEYKL